MKQNLPSDRLLNQLLFLEADFEPKLITSSSKYNNNCPNNDDDDDNDGFGLYHQEDKLKRSSGATSYSSSEVIVGSSSSPSMDATSNFSTHEFSPSSFFEIRNNNGSSDVSDDHVQASSVGNNKNNNDESLTPAADGTIRVPSGSGYRIMTPFPWRLHEILEEVEHKKLDWIVSWLPDGRGFQVHCQKSFSEKIIPMFFRHSRYKSFQRQLYLYGFRSLETHSLQRGMYQHTHTKCSCGCVGVLFLVVWYLTLIHPFVSPWTGAYFHPKFVKNNRPLCKDIVRVKTETTPKKSDGRKKGSSVSSSSRKTNNKKASLVSSSTSSKNGDDVYSTLQKHHQGISSSCYDVGQQQQQQMTMIDFHGTVSSRPSSQAMMSDLQTTSCSGASSNSGSTRGNTPAPAAPVADNMAMIFNRTVTAGFSDHILQYKDDIIDLFGHRIVG
jgi:hypothetical protein